MKTKNGYIPMVGMVATVTGGDAYEFENLKGVIVAVYEDTVMICSGEADGYYECLTEEIEVIKPDCGYGIFLFDEDETEVSDEIARNNEQ